MFHVKHTNLPAPDPNTYVPIGQSKKRAIGHLKHKAMSCVHKAVDKQKTRGYKFPSQSLNNKKGTPESAFREKRRLITAGGFQQPGDPWGHP
ncbi:hypothetical protein GCM10009125_00260 [Castellaniella daejeonensis]|uniref:Uncharacterized protein n=1 Tax=Castellaniella daejeonensis TaxID=659013 RepID=A0ABN0T8E5_9BURK